MTHSNGICNIETKYIDLVEREYTVLCDRRQPPSSWCFSLGEVNL